MKGIVSRITSTYNEQGINGVVRKGVQKCLSNDTIQAKMADVEFKRGELPDVTDSSDGPRHVVLVVVVDCLRADVIDADVSPTLADLEGTTAVTPAPWTYPSVTSINTGLYPHEHGSIRQNDDPDNNTDEKVSLPPKLDPDTPTLSEYFASGGYRTYGAFAFQMPFLALSGRFETHELYTDADSRRVIEDYLDWLRERCDERTFAYIHLSDLHDPVNPPTEYWEKYEVSDDIPNITRWDYTDEWTGSRARIYQEHRKRLYKAAVEYADDQISTLLTDAQNITSSDPAVVITGDHGEAFWERSALDAEHFYDSRSAYSVGHGGTPYESLARVPLVGKNIDIRDGEASTVDVFPTLLEKAGIAGGDEVSGISHARKLPDDRVIVEATRNGYEKKAGYKLIVSKGDGESLGFSVPEEELTELPPDIESDLRDALPDWPSGGTERQISGTVQQRLDDLGYA